MKKLLIKLLICAVLFCFSCTQASKQSEVLVHADSSISVQKDEPIITLPNGFRLDSIQGKDTSSNTKIFISYPVLITTKTAVNSTLKNQLLKELDKFLETVCKPLDSGMPNKFEVETDYVFTDGNTVSYRFIIATYKSFAVHPFTFYKGFSYDLSRDEQIVFSDYFRLKGVQDSVILRAVINKQINRPAGFGIPHIENSCFTLGKDSVTFYFDDNNATNEAVDIIKASVPKALLNQFIR